MFDGAAAGWHASLELRVRAAGGRSLVTNRHVGPLRIQKALYPEGDSPCHAVVLHPPGGIAGGDTLAVEVDVQPGAHALVTTPGAAKWYKANGRIASQRVALTVAGDLEWLPQEAIVYDAADVRSSISIDIDSGGRVIGWDIVALGRHAAGEAFARGFFAQTIRLRYEGRLIWVERTRIRGGDGLLDSPIGMAGRHVFGCLWAAGPIFDDRILEDVRSKLAGGAPLTRLVQRLLVVRSCGRTTGAVRSALTSAWSALRPLVFDRPASCPRVWAT